jgi:4-hydroxy-tetrahydrodipicolinate synthase
MEKVEKEAAQVRSAGAVGVIVPIITPIDENEEVDVPSLRTLIRRLLGAGVHGVFAGGSAGMGPMLLERQWRCLMETVREEVDESHLCLGGVICASTPRAVERIKVLDELGFEGMVVTPTYYISLEYEEEFIAHFGKCREATDMDMVIYNIPGCTGCTIPIDVLAYMAEHKWMKMIKDSSKDLDYMHQLIRIGGRWNISVLQGDEGSIDKALRLGAAGIVPVCANYEPETYVSAIRAARQNDPDLLAQMQGRISEIRRTILFGGDYSEIAGIMYAASVLGIGNGRPLLPLQQLGMADKRRIDRFYAEKQLNES